MGYLENKQDTLKFKKQVGITRNYTVCNGIKIVMQVFHNNFQPRKQSHMRRHLESRLSNGSVFQTILSAIFQSATSHFQPRILLLGKFRKVNIHRVVKIHTILSINEKFFLGISSKSLQRSCNYPPAEKSL